MFAPLAESVTDCPAQTAVPPKTLTVGLGFTLTVIMAVAEHATKVLVPITLKSVVTVGPGEILEPEKPVFQEYVSAPTAFRFTNCPEQMRVLPEMLTVGF